MHSTWQAGLFQDTSWCFDTDAFYVKEHHGPFNRQFNMAQQDNLKC